MDLDHYTFLSGVELECGTLLFSAQDTNLDIDDAPHTIFLQRNPMNEWSRRAHTRWLTAGVSKTPDNDGLSVINSWGRNVELMRDKNGKSDIFPEVDSGQETPWTVRFCKSIDGVSYAGGTGRHLCRKVAGSWEPLGPAAMQEGPQPASFDGITGFNASELYAFGWRSVTWSNHSGDWEQVEMPTNVILTDGDIFQDKIYIGGQIGTILEGRGADWIIIENEILEQDIWSVCAFQDAVYFSCMFGILRLKDGELELFKQLGPDMRTAMSLFVGPSGLWSVGASDIVLFDGTDWHTIAQSD